MPSLGEYFTAGVRYLDSHRQLLLALALLLIIPLAFLWSGQQFLSASGYTSERLEKDRIGMLHDAFAVVLSTTADPSTLQTYMQKLKDQNPDLVRFSIFKLRSGTPELVVGVGDRFDVATYGDIITLSSVRKDESILFEEYSAGARHWIGVRTIVDLSGLPLYFITTDISMETLDALLNDKIQSAYISLAFIMLFVVILLWRQVRLLDYSRLYDELKKAHATMSLFVNMTAHELRTPLTAIKGYASMLSEDTALSTLQASYAKKIEVSSDTLIVLISDLLDLASLQSGKLKFAHDQIDLGDTILQTITLLQPLAKKSNLTLKNDFTHNGPFHIFGDEKRLVQVFTNIIGNSLKYTKEGTISISIKKIRHSYEIRVKDTGMGISADDQKRLFAPYFRVASSETNGISGTGLGMWITKRMIEEMGGAIDVESIKDVGTHIVVTFNAELS